MPLMMQSAPSLPDDLARVVDLIVVETLGKLVEGDKEYRVDLSGYPLPVVRMFAEDVMARALATHAPLDAVNVGADLMAAFDGSDGQDKFGESEGVWILPYPAPSAILFEFSVRP